MKSLKAVTIILSALGLTTNDAAVAQDFVVPTTISAEAQAAAATFTLAGRARSTPAPAAAPCARPPVQPGRST